jgi:hypothetical protein
MVEWALAGSRSIVIARQVKFGVFADEDDRYFCVVELDGHKSIYGPQGGEGFATEAEALKALEDGREAVRTILREEREKKGNQMEVIDTETGRDVTKEWS